MKILAGWWMATTDGCGPRPAQNIAESLVGIAAVLCMLGLSRLF
jgi:hypothetical protein